jgi:hypothetical protein
MPLPFNFIECAEILGISGEDFCSSAFFVFICNFLTSFV